MRRWLFALFVLGIVGSSAQVPTFSHAQSARDVDPVVTPSYVVGACTLQGPTHDDDPRSFYCGKVWVHYPQESEYAVRMLEEVGQKGELIWRRTK